MSEFFTGLSDFFTNNWGQIVAILSSSTIIPTIISGIFKAFTTKSQNKSIKKLITAVDDKFNAIETQITNVETKYKNIGKEYVEEFKKTLKEVANDYSNAKKEMCDKIVAGKDKVKDVLLEVDKITEEISDKMIELQPLLEEAGLLQDVPVVEETVEEVQEEKVEEAPKSDVKVAKRVIVGE